MNQGITSEFPADIRVRNILKPGDLGYLTYLHGILYAAEYGWDHTFEAYVAGPLAKFAQNYGPRERIWVVEQGGRVAGSLAVVEASRDEAQLRWLLLHPDLRGRGIGRGLLREAIDFGREQGYTLLFLWTVSMLAVALHLYEAAGFRLTEEKTHELWGTVLTEQRYELRL